MNRLLTLILLFNSSLSHKQAMNWHSIFAILAGFFVLPFTVYTQEESAPKVSFGIGGGVGGRGLGKTPYVQNYGIELLKYAGKPQEAWGGGYYSLNEKGEIVEVKWQKSVLTVLHGYPFSIPSKTGGFLM